MDSPLAGNVAGKLKSGYFFLEDRYYGLLDKINKHVPVYKVIDPIDKVVPSFLLFIAIILLLAVFFIFVAQVMAPATAILQVVDSKDNALEGVSISLSINGQEIDFSTDDFGEAIVPISGEGLEAEGLFEKEGYKTLERSVTLTADETSTVTLQIKEEIELQPKELTIRVFDSKTNKPILKTVNLAFECSSGSFAPESQEGSTGEFKVVKPVNCSSLSARARSQGYVERSKTLASTINTIYLSPEVIETTGKISVIVKNTLAEPEPDVIVRVMDETTDLEVDSSSTGTGGNALISGLQPGQYTVSVITVDGRMGRETGVSVSAGGTEVVRITLLTEAEAKSKKIFLEVVEQGTTDPISEAHAFIYVDDVFVDSTSSDSLGIVEKRIVEPVEAASHLVVLTHPDFLTTIVDNVALKELTDETPIKVEMVRASMEDPATSSEILVTVVDEDLAPVENALVTVYSTAYPEIPLKKPAGRTSSDDISSGTFLFTNLAPGEYIVKAEDADGTSEGTSDPGTTIAGQTLEMQLILVLGEGDVEVLVFDSETEQKAPIAGAEVEFIDADDFPTVIASCTTDVQGKCTSEPIPADNYVVVRAKAAGYISAFGTLTIDIINRNTSDVEVGLEHDSSLPPGINKVDVRFRQFCEDRGCKKPASMVNSDELGTLTYYAKFELLFTEDVKYENTVQHVRVGPDSEIELPLPNGYKIRLLNAHGPIAKTWPLSSCWNNDPVDPFADPEECAALMDAKQVNIYYPDLEGKQIIPLVVEFAVEPGLEDGEELEMHYIAKTTVAEEGIVTANKVKYFLINEFLCEDKAIAWSFSVINPDETETVLDLGEEALNELSTNESYHLAFEMYNCSNRDFPSSQLKAESLPPELEVISFTALEPFDTGPINALGQESFSFAADTILSGQIPFYTVNEADLTEFQFSFTAGNTASTQTIPFEVSSNLRLMLSYTPKKLPPNRPGDLFGIVKDRINQAELIKNARVVLKIDGQDPMDTTTNDEGYFEILNIDGLEGLSEVTVTVRKAGYKTLEETIPIGFDSGSQNPSLDCVGIEKGGSSDFALNFVRGSTNPSETKGSFEVVNNCNSPVVIHLESELKTDAAQDFTIDPASSKTITVSAEAWENFPEMTIGEYGVMVMGRFSGDPPEAGFVGPLATAVIYVTDPTSCFRLADPNDPQNADAMKSSFDTISGADDGLIVNECFVYFEDLRMPRLETVRGYAAAENLFKLVFNAPTKPAELIDKQKVFDSNNVGFDSEGKFEFELIDSAGYVFVDWVDFLMTDQAHETGATHRVWAQTNRNVWINVTAQLPFTPTKGPGKASTLPHPVIDNEGRVDIDTYYIKKPGSTQYKDEITVNPMWQGQHNVCNRNLTGFESGLSQCNVPGYFQGTPIVPYKAGVIADKLALETSSVPTTLLSAARWRYISTDADHEGLIDFTIQNKGLMGDTYALIEVEDTIGVDFVAPGAPPPGGGPVGDTNGLVSDWALSKKCDIVKTYTTEPMLGPLVAQPGKIIAVSVDSGAGVFSSLIEDMNSLLPEKPKNISEVVLFLNDQQPRFKLPENPGGEEMVLMAFSGGRWSKITRFDTEQPGEDHLQDSAMQSAEIVAFVNNTNGTDLMIDSLEFNYNTAESVSGNIAQGIAKIPVGQAYIEVDLPADTPPLGNCVSGTLKYLVEETSPDAIAYFSGSRKPTSPNPYGNSEKIIIATSSPEQTSRTKTERFHIRIAGEAAEQCLAANGMVGSTGIGSKPRVLLDWDWDSLSTTTCNEENEDFVYCDPTQFTSSLIKRLEEMRSLADANITKNLMEIRKMQLFNAYFIEDALSDDFRNDFVEFYGNQFLVDEMTNEEHPWGDYLLEGERLVFDTTAASEGDMPESAKFVDAGLHEVYIDLDFDEDQFDFFFIQGSNVDLLANITVYITKLSDPLINNPFYYLPFNGDLGRADGVLHRDGYGLVFGNLSQPLVIVGDIEEGTLYTTESPGESTGRKSVTTENISDFYYTNRDNKGMILQVENNQEDIKFSPSIATPVLAEMISDTRTVEAYYWVRDNQGILSDSTVMALWTGAGSSMREGGVCTDFDGWKLKTRIPDKPLSSACGTVGTSFGFSYELAPENQKLYLETTFYAPWNSGVTLRKSCENGTNFYAPGPDGVQKTETLDRPISLSTPDMQTTVATMADVVGLIGDGYVCVSQSQDDDYFTFWWNPQKVIEGLDDIKAEIPGWTSLDCSGALSTE